MQEKNQGHKYPPTFLYIAYTFSIPKYPSTFTLDYGS